MLITTFAQNAAGHIGFRSHAYIYRVESNWIGMEKLGQKDREYVCKCMSLKIEWENANDKVFRSEQHIIKDVHGKPMGMR